MMQSIHDFVRKHGISISCTRTDKNPHMHADDKWQADHWKCSLKRKGGKRMTVHFSMGTGHGGKQPTAEEVLSAIASDASSVVNASGFEDWASDLGFETDSRKAHKTYNTVKKQAASLKKFIGDAYEELLYETEGL